MHLLHGWSKNVSVYSIRTIPLNDKCVLTMSFNRMYEGNCYNNYSINNNLEIRAQGLSNNQMLESSVCCHSKQTSALFLSESSFVDGEEKLHTIAFYFMKMR